MLKFFNEENYCQDLVTFQMPPPVRNERLPCLTAEAVKKALEACTNPRDKALILRMVD
jgi:hypothetical protein